MVFPTPITHRCRQATPNGSCSISGGARPTSDSCVEKHARNPALVDLVLDFVPVRRDETGEFFLVVSPRETDQPQEREDESPPETVRRTRSRSPSSSIIRLYGGNSRRSL